jgi:glycosyltransferase involved in cell wall biosynthesis
VYPTLYEGFGLPVIEAMANGCPVIASHYTSIPEVAGQAALYIDPMDPKSMLNAFEKFVETPTLQKELSEKGLEQSQKFSKEKFITGMINVFESAVRDFKK